jgi:hypothetical protein
MTLEYSYWPVINGLFQVIILATTWGGDAGKRYYRKLDVDS